MSRRVLVDLNVILDVLLDRLPHAEDSAALWSSIESGRLEGLLSAHAVTTLHYLAVRAGGRDFAQGCVASVLSVFGVAPVDGAVFSHALALDFADFEDAVCSAAAKAAKCDTIATRDAKGFLNSPVPALHPRLVAASV